MTKKKKTILITAISAAVLAVCGCIGIYRHVSRFDASDYVRAVLDASYKNETDLYVEITGIPEEEAAGIFDENLDLTPVTVKSITLFTDTYGTFQSRAQEYAEEVTDRVTAGAQMPTEEEMQKQVYEIYYEVLKERVDSGMLYGAARDIGVRVTKEGARNFSINEEDMEKLDSLLIESVQE